MSESAYLESSHVFVHNLLNLANEVNTAISKKDKSADAIYQMYIDILTLYEKSSILPLSESDKLLIQDKKEEIYLRFKLFKIKQDMKNQLADIQAELEDLKKPVN